MRRSIALWPFALVAAAWLVGRGPTSWWSASAHDRTEAPTAARVVLVTLDGVRREELLGELEPSEPAGRAAAGLVPMPFFRDELLARGSLLGAPDSGTRFTVANTEVMSLPGYQSMMAGRPQPCFSNECGRIYLDRTLPEQLVRRSGFKRSDVATFASWAGVGAAVETTPGTTFVSAGRTHDGGDAETRAIESEAATDLPPWGDARWDRYTERLALRYLQQERPRFLYVSLNDTDAWAHKRDYGAYLRALGEADAFLRTLVQELRATRAPGETTCLMVTTDHGRGRGAMWAKHSNGVPYAALVWAFATCTPFADEPMPLASGRKLNRSLFTHLDLRPTIETWLGVPPHRCLLCGEPIVGPRGWAPTAPHATGLVTAQVRAGDVAP